MTAKPLERADEAPSYDKHLSTITFENILHLDYGALEDVGDSTVNVNMQDTEGMTMLHHAAALGFRDAVRALVTDGRCDYSIRDNQGRYAFELALEWSGDIAVARLLEKKLMQQAAARGVPAYIQRVKPSH